MHSVITEDDTGHMDSKRTHKRRGKILYKQHTTGENQVNGLHILSFSRILYKNILLSNSRC